MKIISWLLKILNFKSYFSSLSEANPTEKHETESREMNDYSTAYRDMEFVENFVGFYMKKGFWVEKRLDLDRYSDARKMCGPSGEIAYTYECASFKLAVTIEGMLLLHHRCLAASMPPMGDVNYFNDALLWWEQFIDYAYALQAIIESSTIRLEAPCEVNAAEILPDNTSTIGLAGWSPVSGNRNGNRIIAEEFRDLSSYTDFVFRHGRVPQHYQFSAYSWPEVQRRTLEHAVTRFEYVVNKPKLLKWLAFVVRAKVSYGKNDFAMSFLHSWFVIESACKNLYDTSLTDGGPRSAKMTMAKISKALETIGILSPAFVVALDEVRDVRNRLVHEPDRTNCTSDECKRAGQLAIDLATHGHELDLILNWHCGVRF